jgi:hypothetical protein
VGRSKGKGNTNKKRTASVTTKPVTDIPNENLESKQFFKDYKITGISFSIIALLLFIYGIVNQFLDTNSVFLSGPKFLIVEQDHLVISTDKVFRTIELEFEDKVEYDELTRNSFVHLNGIHGKRLSEKATLGGNGKRVQFSLKKEHHGNKLFTVIFNERFNNEAPIKRTIKSVFIDNNKVSIFKFYNEYLNPEESNVKYVRAFDYRYFSCFLARAFGRHIVIILMFILIVLFSVQLILIIMIFTLQLISPTHYKLGRLAPPPLNYFDILSKDYAVVFGFLGTITSLWVALETSDSNLAGRYEIFDTIKLAIFTTVLGLATRSLFAIREFIYNVYLGRDIVDKK